MEKKIAIALSEKSEEEAIKEAALQIKYIFPKTIKYLLVFFTPHYLPTNILKELKFILKPLGIIGIQSPFLIFEEKIIEKGIIVSCINKDIYLKQIFIEKDEPQIVESTFRTSLINFKKEKKTILSVISSNNINPQSYLKSLEFSLGKFSYIVGCGFLKTTELIVNNRIAKGVTNIIIGDGLNIQNLKLSGFIPLGRPFKITKVSAKRNVILEIENKPAIEIYKYYLEEKFELAKKNFLFPLYPLGIKETKGYRLINIIDALEDGSLVCFGEIKEDVLAQFMFFSPNSLFESLKNKIKILESEEENLIIIINSLIRKKILKEQAKEEIKLIRKEFSSNSKIIGFFSDYYFLNQQEGKTFLETGNTLILKIT
ncbi:MAG: FIST C-terminal domain-containing protein [Candidatus Aenigmatarchaeota archaeon]